MKRGNKQKLYLQNVLNKHLLDRLSGIIRRAFKSRDFPKDKWVAYSQVADSVLLRIVRSGRHGGDANSGCDDE